MTNFIPIFPLNLVVYPGEELNLHIFEPKYKQLINECYLLKKPFGIPSVIENQIQDYGTIVTITEISKVYDNEEMDIKTKGEKVFRILEVIKEIPEKRYSGAIVNYPVNHHTGNNDVMRKVLTGIKELHKLLNIEKEFNHKEELSSYDIAHHIGLSIHEEYELLNLMHERQRQEYLSRHLSKVIPLVKEMDKLKQKIKLNGHFKNLSSFDINL